MSDRAPWVARWLSAAGVLPRAAIAHLDAARAPSARSVLDAGRLAERVYGLLDEINRDVVLVARMGQNLEEFGLKYSHLGLAVRALRCDEWGVVHLLTRSEASRSSLYCEGLVNFFSDNPYRMACLAQTLPPSVEGVLYKRWRLLAKQMHCEHYSLTSHPWSLVTQNSNQWVLETLAAASTSEVCSRDTAQQWLRSQGYLPTCLHIGLPTQWAGPLLRSSVRFDDQPEEDRLRGEVRTVTVDSVLNFLEQAPAYEAERLSLRRLEISL